MNDSAQSPNTELDKSLQELIQTGQGIFGEFDKVSKSVSQFERAMNDAKIYFPYRLKVKGDKEGQNWFLSWERVEQKNQRFRLMLICEEADHLNECRLIFRYPLIETKMDMRIDFGPCVLPFIKEFNQYLINQQNKIKSGDYSEIKTVLSKPTIIKDNNQFEDEYPDFLRE